jgi:hypothetical protein
MALKLKGSTSGFTAIDAPAVAGDNTLVLPGGNGSNGQYLQTDGSGTLSWATVTNTDTQAVAGASFANPNTTSVSWTSLPANIQWIQLGYNGGYSSTFNSSSERPLVQVQTGGSTWKNSGYINYGWNAASTVVNGFNGDIGGINPYYYIDNTSRETTTFSLQRIGTSTSFQFSLQGSITGSYLLWSSGYFDAGAEITGIRVTTFNGTATLNGAYWMNYGVR